MRYEIPSVVDNYLGSKPGDFLQKVLQKHIYDLIQQYSLQKPTDPLENKSYLMHPIHQALYEALTESLISNEDDMKKAKTIDTLTQKKKQNDDRYQDPHVGPDQGLKKRKTSKDG
uniref:Uncharacterized protein n=1 Tax=Tanacetum cinerariifolium TaxID=118510 RepID=A0A699KS18_TANCI|nr:hypothetical protein [Tanacetum cinerariifolium]